MSIFRSFTKEAGRLRVEVSEPAPRWFTITATDVNAEIRGLQIEEIRDLHYLLGRMLALVEEDDRKSKT